LKHVKLKRRFYRLILVLVILAGAIWKIFWSTSVQIYLYPIPHERYVFGYAAVYDLDPYLIASVMRAESRFAHNAESGSGARGLMQVMPETAKWVAQQLKIPYHSEMLFEPKYNIMIGCYYLRELFHVFGNNLSVVLAAYNAGQGNVGKWLESGIWDGKQAHLDQIPFRETRVYVARVLNNYQKYQELYVGKEASD
jgi:soluble lytic murein transglycosylase